MFCLSVSFPKDEKISKHEIGALFGLHYQLKELVYDISNHKITEFKREKNEYRIQGSNFTFPWIDKLQMKLRNIIMKKILLERYSVW